MKFFLRDTAGSPERARWLHLAHSGSQIQCAIWFILPARGARHIIKRVIVVLLNVILLVPHPFPFSPPTPNHFLSIFHFCYFFLCFTFQITRKLAGAAAGTAAWATNIGNEFGQVLISVLTASEGSGLCTMASGIIGRYQLAGVPPRVLVYTDRDCCGERNVKSLFAAWDEVTIHLDAWHFMLRFVTGCTTESHPLYPTFMAQLS